MAVVISTLLILLTAWSGTATHNEPLVTLGTRLNTAQVQDTLTTNSTRLCVEQNLTIPLIATDSFYDPLNGEIYLTNAGGVIAVNLTTSTYKVVSPLGGGRNPVSFAFDGTNDRVFVGNYFQDSLSVVDARNDTVIHQIPLTISPYEVLYDPFNGMVYVAGEGSSVAYWNLTTVSSVSYSVVSNIPILPFPGGLALDPNTNTLFVANDNGYNVTLVNLTSDTLVGDILVGPEPNAILYDGTTGEIYVDLSGYSQVAVINPTTNTVVNRIPIPGLSSSGAMAVSPVTGTLYVGSANGVVTVNVSDDQVAGNTQVWEGARALIPPSSISISPDGLKAYVTGFSDGGRLYVMLLNGGCAIMGPTSGSPVWTQPWFFLTILVIGILVAATVILALRRKTAKSHS